MLNINRIQRLLPKVPVLNVRTNSTQVPEEVTRKDDEEFQVLNLRQVRTFAARRKIKTQEVPPPRFHQMAVDQDWGSVWPGPRTFHPATVPLPLRQGFTEKGKASPGKFGNAELMKIPNFLHLTPPVVKRQCEALKKFCTPWPAGLETEAAMQENFPVETIASDYCHGLPSIRNPLARIITIRLKLSNLPLDKHARDKFLRLVGNRYNADTDVLTIVTDRCPLRKQNYEYAQYLLTALFHESWVHEPWESTKIEADMEEYIWSRNKSKTSSEAILNWANESGQPIAAPATFAASVEQLINEGENEHNIQKYKAEVVKMLGLKSATGEQLA